MNIWICMKCGFLYDESIGIPGEGIAAGTAWEDVPEDWVCSYCGAEKSGFEMKRVPVSAFELSVMNP